MLLCAGAIHSPTILQRSGFGPSSLLKSLNIPVIKELPIGKNLLDHPIMRIVLDLKPECQVSPECTVILTVVFVIVPD